MSIRPVVAYLETKDNKLKKAAFESASIANSITQSYKTKNIALLVGKVHESELDKLPAFGFYHVIVLESEYIISSLIENYISVIKEKLDSINPAVVIGCTSPEINDLFPALAGLLKSPIISDCIEFRYSDQKLMLKKQLYGGSLNATLSYSGEKTLFVTFRPNSYQVIKTESSPFTTEVCRINIKEDANTHTIIANESDSAFIDINDADIIVSGGRAFKSKNEFETLKEIARLLNGGVGASRAAVDAGFAEQNTQIGQTGKTVSPKLYIAFGLSGAIQHLAGMKSSKIIIAVNKDTEAPIFKFSNYGIVDDAFQIADEIKKQLIKQIDSHG